MTAKLWSCMAKIFRKIQRLTCQDCARKTFASTVYGGKLRTCTGILRNRLDQPEVGSTGGGHKVISKPKEVFTSIILSICTFCITFLPANFGILDNNFEQFITSRQVGRQVRLYFNTLTISTNADFHEGFHKLIFTKMNIQIYKEMNIKI